MNALKNMDRIQISNEIILLLLSLYESKGKSFYYDTLFLRDLSSFQKKTLENNIFSFAKLINLNLTDQRIKLFAKKDMVPRNKEEHLLSNIKKALTKLHENKEAFELLPNEIENLIKLLGKNFDSILFQKYKSTSEGLLNNKKTISKKDVLDKLISMYNTLERQNKFELTQMIANFFVDFNNLDLFTSNGEMVSYIILYALLFKHFGVFKYVSFFSYLYLEKEALKNALISANYYWEQGFSQTDHLSRILINILLSCYREVDKLAYEYAFEKDLNKSDNIENSILKLNEIFTKEDLRKRHPNVSDATIDRTLKRLKDEDKIRPLGKGRSSKWQRVVSGHKKFNGQLSLFD